VDLQDMNLFERFSVFAKKSPFSKIGLTILPNFDFRKNGGGLGELHIN
jgi:hypothetical protein